MGEACKARQRLCCIDDASTDAATTSGPDTLAEGPPLVMCRSNNTPAGSIFQRGAAIARSVLVGRVGQFLDAIWQVKTDVPEEFNLPRVRNAPPTLCKCAAPGMLQTSLHL